jgi:outer membrane protein insertion porin family
LTLAAAGIVLLVGVVRARLDGWAQSHLERTLSRTLNADVSFVDLRVTPLRLQVEFEGLRIAGRGERREGLDARVERGRVRLAWRGLAALPAGRLHLANVDLVAPVIRLERGNLEERPDKDDGGNRLLDWRIDHLAIRGGAASYSDVELPLDLEARDLELAVDWSLFRRAVVGRASLRAEIDTPSLGNPYALSLAGSFRFRGTRLELVNLEVEAPHLRGEEIAGHVLFEEGWPLSLRGRVIAEATALRPWVREDWPAIEGQLHGDLFLDAVGGEIRLGGAVESHEAHVGPLEIASLEARLGYSPGELAIEHLRAAVLGGHVIGSGLWRFGRSPWLSTELRGREIDLGRLFELLGTPYAVASGAEIEASFEGDPTRASTWRGSGRMESLGLEDDERLPMDARVAYELVDGQLEIRDAELEAAAVRAEMSIRLALDARPIAGEIVVSGTTSAARRSQVELIALLEDAGTRVPAALEHPVRGAGSATARIGIGGEPDVDLSVRLTDGSWGRWGFDRGEVDLAYRGREIELRRADVDGPDGESRLSGWFDAEERTILRLDGELRDVALAPLFALLDVPLVIEGRVDGEVGLAQGPGGLEGGGQVAVRNLAVVDEPMGELEARFTVHRNVMDLHEIRLTGPGFGGRGEILLDLSEGVLDGEIVEGHAELAELGLLTRRGIRAAGEALVSGAMRYTPDGLLGEIQMTAPEVSVEGFGLGRVEGDLEFRPEGIDFQVSSGRDHGLKLEGRAEWGEGVPVTAVLYLDGTTVDLTTATSVAAVWMRLDGHVLVEGPLAKPDELVATGELDSVVLQLGGSALRSSGPVPLGLRAGEVTLGPARWSGRRTDLRTEARVDLGERTLESTLRGTVDLGIAATLLPEVRATGPVAVDLVVAGPWDRPEPRGTLELDNGRIRLLGFPDPLNAVEMRMRLAPGEIVLDEARAVLGGGELTATGRATLDGLAIRDYDLDLEVASSRVRYPPHFKGVYDGALRLRGGQEDAILSGDLRLVRGLYEEDFDFTRVFGPRSREYAPGDAVEFPVSLFLDVDLQADGEVWIRNRMVDLESAMDLHLGGEIRRPEFTGRVWLEEGGEIRYRAVEYRIQSGSLDLMEVQRINPYVEIRAETTIGEYAIFLHVQGTVDRLRYSLTSDPSLSPQDIIALLTTGRTLETLSTGTDDFKAGFTGDVVTNYFASALTQPFERQLEKLLRLEQVRVDPLLIEGEADATTRLTLGKEVTDDVLVVYSTNLNQSGTDIYRMQWKATRRLRVSAESGVAGGVGSDLRYSRRFWFRRPEPEDGAAGIEPAREIPPTQESTGETVGLLRIDGAGPDGSKLLDRLPLRSGGPFTRAKMLQGALTLRRHFVNDGRIEARVETRATPREDQGIDVVYEVEPGPSVKVVFEGVGRKDGKRLRRHLQKLWLESIFPEELYSDAVARILDYFKDRGYYAADVVLNHENSDGVKVARFEVDAGKPVGVAAIHLEGVESVSEDEVRRQMLTRSSTAFSRNELVPSVLDEDIGAIRTLYREHGFLEVVVDPPRIALSADGEHAELHLRVHEGPQFRIGAVRAPEGLIFPAEQIVEWSGLETGSVFRPGGLVEAESALRVELDERGYPDARIASDVEIRNESVEIVLDVVTGEQKRVGTIEIAGNHKTRNRVIERELLLEPGDLLSRDRLLQIQHRLYALGIFRSVRIRLTPLEVADPTLQKVTVQVEESPPQRMIFGAGYNTETGLRGSFALSNSNVRGTNRRMAVQGGASEVNRRIEWVGEDPRLFGRRDLQGLANISWQEAERVSFDERRFSAAGRIAQKLNERWGHFLRYSFQKVDLLNLLDVGATVELRVEDLALGNVGYGAVRTTRDDPFAPTRGTYFSSEVRVYAPVFVSDASFTRYFGQGAWVKTFGNRTQLASAFRLGLEWPFGNTPFVPISERFFTGGHDTLRGFERDTVGPKDENGLPTGGQAMIVANLEYRYPIWKLLVGDVFYDTGNVFWEVGDVNLGELRHVLGLGLRLETALGPIRLEYGWKVDREPGESPGELYLSLGNAF